MGIKRIIINSIVVAKIVVIIIMFTVCPFSSAVDNATSSLRFVHWNGTSCVPDVCGGADMSHLLPIIAKVPVHFIESNHWYDQKRTLKCFSNRYITIIGDSTNEETFFDIYHLLSGAFRNGKNNSFIIEEDKIMHHVNNKKSSDFKFTPEDPEVIVHYHGSNGIEGSRNMTMLVPEYNITVRFRFSGHMVLTENWGGLSSMLREDFQNYELDCLFGIESEQYHSCPLPDILIFQSAAHDRSYQSEYRKYLHILFTKMRNLVNRNHKHTRC